MVLAPTPEVSWSAKADHLVNTAALVITGSPAFADDDRQIKRGALQVAATAALAAVLSLSLLATTNAQEPLAKPPHVPAAKPAAAKKPAPAPAPAPQPAQAAPPAQQNGPKPDLAFGAFQRGYYLTAFSLATQRATAKNDAKSMTLLGELYANGLGVPQDDQKAASWYRLAAARGDPNAMFALAMFDLQGRAGPRNRPESAKWLAAAAKLGHSIAAYDLALLYIEGELFPRDFSRAAQLLRQAADAGNPQAQYALGTLYKDGRGVPQDMKEAVHLFALAALGDQTDAEVEYGIALFNGDGVAPNQELAAELFRKAATKGNPIAQDRLALILSKGVGAKADPIEAAKWHLIAKAAGDTDIDLDVFVSQLDATARATAEKRAKPWIDFINQAIAARTAAQQHQQQTPAPAANAVAPAEAKK
jgi:uncharacterized protein